MVIAGVDVNHYLSKIIIELHGINTFLVQLDQGEIWN